jgi:hypothetical protein
LTPYSLKHYAGCDHRATDALRASHWHGDHSYRSRDYRNLGTIGWFDGVVLPLKKGDNEIRIAVAEGFGGWGIMGRICEFE